MIHSANVEKFAHEGELQKMVGRWDEIKVPVIYMQGQQDDLIYTSNAAFARQHLVNSARLNVKMLPGLGHLIAFKAHAQIRKAMDEMLPQCAAFYASRKENDPDWQAGISDPETLPMPVNQ
jgi:pimeloyl-ACP methyl ester carboxylesterase